MEIYKRLTPDERRAQWQAMREAPLVGVAPIAAFFAIWGLVLGPYQLLYFLVPLAISWKTAAEAVKRDMVIRIALILFSSISFLCVLAFYYVHGSFILVWSVLSLAWFGVVGVRVQRHITQAANNSLQGRRP